jgi:hypothetical protein
VPINDECQRLVNEFGNKYHTEWINSGGSAMDYCNVYYPRYAGSYPNFGAIILTILITSYALQIIYYKAILYIVLGGKLNEYLTK